MFPKECLTYGVEVIFSKATFITPRTELGVHLAYENRLRGDRLRFHLERNLSSHRSDRYTLHRLYYRVESDFRLLAEELTKNHRFKNIQTIEGITNFQEKTGKRYGFKSEVIIDNPFLRDIFEARIQKPSLSGFESGAPIRRFTIDKDTFLELFSPDSPRIFKEVKETLLTD